MCEKVKPLYLEDGLESGVFYCTECRAVNTTNLCYKCSPQYCKHCDLEIKEKGWTICSDCRASEERKKEKEKFDKAQKVNFLNYQDFVFDPNSELYFESPEDYLEYELEEDVVSEYIWTCEPYSLSPIDAGWIAEQATEEMHEEAYDQISDKSLKELQTALDKFVSDNNHIQSYKPNYKKALVKKKI